MKAYFDCFSGISGDMTLAAFMDLGVPSGWLKDMLKTVPIPEFDFNITRVKRMGIMATQVEVRVERHNHHRDYSVIRKLIEGSSLSSRVKELSQAVFARIAAAEAEIHGCHIENVHFHEVGGTDALVDIIGACLCMDFLGVMQCEASAIPLGSGFVKCSHGVLPVPAPATVSILKGVPVKGTDIPFELTTPTGAAIIRTFAGRFGPMSDLVIANTGYGAGQREFDQQPNLLRILLGTAQPDAADRVLCIETNIDDMNPEWFGFLMERLFKDGALDVVCIPAYMKKNRPATILQVFCHPANREIIVRRILSETTSLGVRFHEFERRILPRRQVEVNTSFGAITVKEIVDPDGRKVFVPEYEACRAIAIDRNMPLKQVYEAIQREANPSLSS